MPGSEACRFTCLRKQVEAEATARARAQPVARPGQPGLGIPLGGGCTRCSHFQNPL